MRDVPFARRGLGLALALALAGCGKADRGQCETMCRNYATITFRDVEAAKLPPNERAQGLADKLSKGLELCVNKCVHANNDRQLECYTDAKNIVELRACD